MDSAYVTVPELRNCLATILHSLVVHGTHLRSQVALQGRACSSVPLVHSGEHAVHATDPLTLAKEAPSLHAVQLLLPCLAENVPTGQGLHSAVSP